MENQSSTTVVHGGDDKLCESCAKLPLTEEDIKQEEATKHAKQTRRYDSGKFNIGTLSEIRLRLKCPVCRLLAATFDNDPQGGRTLEINESSATFNLVWEGERKGFSSSDGLGSVGTRLAFVRENDGSAFGQGRRIQTEQIDTELVSGWLCRCQHEHGNQCGPQGRTDQDSTSTALKLPSRLIDVRSHCIIEVEGPSKYVALSYVWGKVRTLRLLKENRVSLMKPFALDSMRNMIPRTILDAIDLVGRLGFLYLWVDSLCITQDDKNELDQEIQRMDLIYKNSLFTIIAADGVDADAGLAGVQPNSRQNHQVLERVTGHTSLVALYELDDLLSTTVYSTRGWTFQERIFSPRKVVFVNGQVFFQCQLRIWSEDTCYEAQPTNATPDGPYGSLLAMALSPKNPYHTSFQILITNYSILELSYDGDALTAAAGLLRMLTGRFGCEMFQGLPKLGLDAYLLFYTGRGKSKPKRNAQFPSYSWAGWKARVQWFEHVKVPSLSPLGKPIVFARERAWINWLELGLNGLACSISNLPEIVSDRPQLDSTACTRLKEEIPSIGRDVEQAVLKVEDAKPAHGYQYPLLTFMTVSVLFRVCANSFSDLYDKNSEICGYIRYDQSPPKTSKCYSEFILLSETNYADKDFPILKKTKRKRHNLEVQSDREGARSLHSENEYTGDQSPYVDLYDRASYRWDYYWVLLIEWDKGVAERRGIGQIYKVAAEKSFPPGPVWKRIVLA